VSNVKQNGKNKTLFKLSFLEIWELAEEWKEECRDSKSRIPGIKKIFLSVNKKPNCY
jgi:hypothetical protein